MKDNGKKKKTKNISDVVSKTVIPMEQQSEYIDFHNERVNTDISKEEKIRLISVLLKKRTSLQEKKKALFILGHGNDLRSLYGIQKYLKDPDPDLASWAVLAWQECQNSVLGEGLAKLFGEAEDLLLGGLGGNDGKLRYCFVICSLEEKAFAQNDKNKTEKTLKKIDKRYSSKAEKVAWGVAYVKITCLISREVAPGDYVESFINACNNPTPFLRFHYFIVNTHDITDKEIDDYMQEIKSA